MATEDARKLFVAGLPESISEDVLRQIFEATGGKVVDVSLPRERTTGKVRGFGFVTFATSEEAGRARDALDGSMHAGRSISVRPFSSEPPKRGDRFEGRSEAPAAPGGAGGASEDRTLYVGNLPYDTSQQELTQFLTDYGVGPIARIHLPTGPDGRMRGFGFVTLGTADAAVHAVNALRTAEVRGRRLMINIAHPRGDRPPGGGSFAPDRSRPPPSYGGSRGPDLRYPTEPPMSFEGGGGDPDRRRTAAPPEGGGGPGPGGGGGGPGGDYDDRNKKKKKGKGTAATARGEKPGEERRRGGGSNWQAWDDREEDD
jgi:nucleolin